MILWPCLGMALHANFIPGGISFLQRETFLVVGYLLPSSICSFRCIANILESSKLAENGLTRLSFVVVYRKGFHSGLDRSGFALHYNNFGNVLVFESVRRVPDRFPRCWYVTLDLPPFQFRRGNLKFLMSGSG